MNKKRYFLDSPEIKDYMVKGERFTKWSEVSIFQENQVKENTDIQSDQIYFFLPGEQYVSLIEISLKHFVINFKH